jgi:hypothetical protein
LSFYKKHFNSTLIGWHLFCQHVSKNPESSAFRIFLSKPQAWHIIAARSAVYIIKGALRPCISSAPLGLDSPAA